MNLSRCGLQESALIKIMNSENISLKHLDNNCNTITDEAAKYVAKANCISRDLEHVDLSYCGLQQVGFSFILKSLEKATSLNFLDLSSNAIDDSLCTAISKCILNNISSLKHLNLASCSLTENGLLIIVQALNQNKLLNSLDISSNVITERISTALAKTDLFFKNSWLQYLNLSHCQWQGDTLSNVLIMTTNIFNFSSINFSGSEMDNVMAVYLAGFITVNRTLERLVLANCSLASTGLARILSSLKKLTTIKHLDLSGNQISDDEVISLLAAVFSCNELEHLNLSHCLQEAASYTILTAIEIKATLHHLDWSYNSSTDD